MTNINSNKKLKKKKSKEKARKAKQARRSRATKQENRDEKVLEKIKWQSRNRITPIRKDS